MGAKHILVIEDDSDMAGMIDELLRLNGYETRLAADGATALTLCREFSPDAIILDYMLPTMGGAALHEELRKSDYGRNIPVLFLSALPERELRRGAAFDGLTYYMSKPYRANEFVAVIGQILALGVNPAGF